MLNFKHLWFSVALRSYDMSPWKVLSKIFSPAYLLSPILLNSVWKTGSRYHSSEIFEMKWNSWGTIFALKCPENPFFPKLWQREPVSLVFFIKRVIYQQPYDHFANGSTTTEKLLSVELWWFFFPKVLKIKHFSALTGIWFFWEAI